MASELLDEYIENYLSSSFTDGEDRKTVSSSGGKNTIILHDDLKTINDDDDDDDDEVFSTSEDELWNVIVKTENDNENENNNGNEKKETTMQDLLETFKAGLKLPGMQGLKKNEKRNNHNKNNNNHEKVSDQIEEYQKEELKPYDVIRESEEVEGDEIEHIKASSSVSKTSSNRSNSNEMGFENVVCTDHWIMKASAKNKVMFVNRESGEITENVPRTSVTIAQQAAFKAAMETILEENESKGKYKVSTDSDGVSEENSVFENSQVLDETIHRCLEHLEVLNLEAECLEPSLAHAGLPRGLWNELVKKSW